VIYKKPDRKRVVDERFKSYAPYDPGQHVTLQCYDKRAATRERLLQISAIITVELPVFQFVRLATVRNVKGRNR